MTIPHAVLPPFVANATLTVRWAASKEDILMAQKLRAIAFGFCPPETPFPDIAPERDLFDTHARHLIVIDGSTGQCVGTYRLLDFRGAQKAGGFYTQTEFDLQPLSPFLKDTLEVGRSCVHPDYRNGGAITLLWSALARIIQTEPVRFLMGCASVDLTDPSMDPDRIWSYLKRTGWDQSVENVVPHRPYPCLGRPMGHKDVPVLPPLLKGYLRLGARCIGNPSHDPAFRTADFPIWLPVGSMKDRYARHFFRSLLDGGRDS
jgi:putative hemolysin